MSDTSSGTYNLESLDDLWQALLDNKLAPNVDQIADISMELGKLLISRGELVTTAESCTGGMLASSIVDIAGSSKYFHAGLVTYGNQAKQNYLHVAQQDLQKFGAVSESTVIAMVEGALKNEKNSSLAIGVSGVAGPQGGSVINPVGSVWFAIKHNHGSVFTQKFNFTGDRLQVRLKTTLACLIKACLVLLKLSKS